jgi:hypothetical protein
MYECHSKIIVSLYSGGIRSGLVFDEMPKPESSSKSNRNSFGARKTEPISSEKPSGFRPKIRLVEHVGYLLLLIIKSF